MSKPDEHVTKDRRAFWVTSAPIAKYVKHAWPGAWMCSAFRNEGASEKAKELIITAAAATCWHYRERSIPSYGFVTFVDTECVPGTMVRGERIYGYAYQRAGWEHVGFTKAGLWAWQLLPHKFPAPCRALPAEWLQ